jgi:histidinol-phosphate aminotransferase
MDIELYVGGKGHLKGQSNTVKLSSNENPWGPSEDAKQAYRAMAGELHVYPNSDHGALRAAIAQVQGLDAERIICSNGSDELITFLCQAYAGPGDEVLFTEHGFLMYKLCAQAASATPVAVPEKERHTDVDTLLATANENTKLVFIANPNNPTGTMIPEEDVVRLADGLPEHTLLVLDGAYAEFVEGFDGHGSLIEARDNVFMTRTFSKIYGLGGLRLGWGYGPAEVVNTLHRLRGPFNANVSALAAGEAAMRDVEYTEKCREKNAEWRETMREQLIGMGIACDASQANFVLARFGSENEADAADKALSDAGLLVRAVKSYGLPECLRITVGKGADCKLVLHVLREFKEGWVDA